MEGSSTRQAKGCDQRTRCQALCSVSTYRDQAVGSWRTIELGHRTGERSVLRLDFDLLTGAHYFQLSFLATDTSRLGSGSPSLWRSAQLTSVTTMGEHVLLADQRRSWAQPKEMLRYEELRYQILMQMSWFGASFCVFAMFDVGRLTGERLGW